MKTQLRNRTLNLVILIPMSFTLINCAKTEFRVMEEESSVQTESAAAAPGGLGGSNGAEEVVVRNPSSTTSPSPMPTPVVVTPTPVPGAQVSYAWQTGAFGACSAQSQVNVGQWSACQNLTCNGGEQTRAVSCTPRSGTQTRSVQCVRNDGTPVSDSYCQALKPSATQSCQSSCAASNYPTRQACVAGTPCRFSFTTQYLTTDANNPHRNHSKCAANPNPQGLHGVQCFNPYKKNQGGEVKAVAYSGADGYNESVWNRKHPGDCAQGTSVEIHNVYSCLGVCKSGQWVEVETVIGNGTVSPLTGDYESPLSNPWGHPENTTEVVGRPQKHYRCVGQ